MRLLLKVLKWAGIVLGGLVGLVILAIVVVYLIAGVRLNKTYDIQVAAITIPSDEARVDRGRHLVETIGLCVECHGDNLEGTILEHDPVFGRLAPTNLTPGKGGIGGTYSDAD